ncbi:MAG: hypothetical protein M3Z31_02480 [Pseudomonadota bacterium]|nr:hypothetical protein [Pseudomonadota bacterium]
MAASPGRTWPLFLAILGLVAALAGVELYALWTRGRAQAPPAPSVAGVAIPQADIPAGIIGDINSPYGGIRRSAQVALFGWALDHAGIEAIEVHIDGHVYAARYGIARTDVLEARPGYPDSARGGYEWSADLSALGAPTNADQRTIEVVAVARDGRRRVIGTRELIEPAALARFTDTATTRRTDAAPFYILPALSAIGLRGAYELDTWYAAYASSTVRTGMRVPILYLRTTRGAAKDFVFDPDWDIERRCGERRIAEDSLGATIAHAVEHHLPVLFTLNGGVWADASCDVPQWDVNDHLEQDVANCQWNEKNAVMPDDYLKHLPGSQDAPELARSLTFNVYAREVRHYKRRNLQQAGAMIASFAREHPDLFIGVNLDPDTYINPFFEGSQWYDYNPGTLRQFREWLSGTGPYTGRTDKDVPDLSRYRRPKPLTLTEAGRLAGRAFANWNEVDPPRAFPREPTAGRPAYWDDPWTREWETFRRHLVDLHYDELSQWLATSGIPAARIWSSQGFMAPHANARPFAVRITSPMKNYDTGGMSIEGSIPIAGHLGAILYGASAQNNISMETPASLFATFRYMDPGWAVVEINTADLRNPTAEPTYAAGYRSLRDVFNYGGRFVSPMAWNGSNGKYVGKPGYVTFTAWRHTPFEDAARDFMLSHANVPVGARLWTFGTPRHVDSDGWTASRGTVLPQGGALTIVPDDGHITLVSPPEIMFDPARFRHVLLGIDDAAPLLQARISARANPTAPWREIPTRAAGWRMTSGGLAIPLPEGRSGVPFDQLRIELTFATSAEVRLARVALWPRS